MTVELTEHKNKVSEAKKTFIIKLVNYALFERYRTLVTSAVLVTILMTFVHIGVEEWKINWICFFICRRLSVQSSEGHWNEGIHQTAAERTAGRCGEGDAFQTIGDRLLQHTTEGTEALKDLNTHLNKQTENHFVFSSVFFFCYTWHFCTFMFCIVWVQGAKLTFVQIKIGFGE